MRFSELRGGTFKKAEKRKNGELKRERERERKMIILSSLKITI
jgi:hypothetical protein